jgi:hypothetical protein
MVWCRLITWSFSRDITCFASFEETGPVLLDLPPLITSMSHNTAYDSETWQDLVVAFCFMTDVNGSHPAEAKRGYHACLPLPSRNGRSKGYHNVTGAKCLVMERGFAKTTVNLTSRASGLDHLDFIPRVARCYNRPAIFPFLYKRTPGLPMPAGS